MIAEEDTKPPPYIKPAMLRYKREWKGMSVEEAAKRMRIKPERIDLWEAGKASPTIMQGLKLAKVYECYFDELTLDEPLRAPKPKIVPDFRLGPGKNADIKKPAVRDLLIWAVSRRKLAWSLCEDLEESPILLPAKLRAKLECDPEARAQEARQWLGYAPEGRVSAKGWDVSADLRKRMECKGILTFRSAARLMPAQARLLCLAPRCLPVVLFMPEEPAAQMFTLAHGLGLVMLGQSCIGAPFAGKLAVEASRWCDRFAAAFLIPRAEIARRLGDPKRPALDEYPQEKLHRLARQFRVSEHVAFIRMVHLKYVKTSYYFGKKRQEFLAGEKYFQGFGRPKYSGRRHVSAMGELYSTLVVRAWAEDMITVNKAANFMDAGNFMHIADIRKEILNS